MEAFFRRRSVFFVLQNSRPRRGFFCLLSFREQKSACADMVEKIIDAYHNQDDLYGYGGKIDAYHNQDELYGYGGKNRCLS